jgi:hypothetical protein
MLASTLLVTLRGPLKTIDMELPGDIAVGELLPLLLEICGSLQNDPQALPQAGARLQVAGAYTPLPLERTLIDAGVCNGTVLVLQWARDTEQRNATEGRKTPPYGFAPTWARPGVDTSGIGVTWEPLV